MINILYVDDKKNQIFSIKTALEELYGDEYKIIPAESGKKCLEEFTYFYNRMNLNIWIS